MTSPSCFDETQGGEGVCAGSLVGRLVIGSYLLSCLAGCGEREHYITPQEQAELSAAYRAARESLPNQDVSGRLTPNGFKKHLQKLQYAFEHQFDIHLEWNQQACDWPMLLYKEPGLVKLVSQPVSEGSAAKTTFLVMSTKAPNFERIPVYTNVDVLNSIIPTIIRAIDNDMGATFTVNDQVFTIPREALQWDHIYFKCRIEPNRRSPGQVKEMTLMFRLEETPLPDYFSN
jgi:hypothetical protein